MSPGAAMTPGERAARDEARRLEMMCARLTRELERVRVDLEAARQECALAMFAVEGMAREVARAQAREREAVAEVERLRRLL